MKIAEILWFAKLVDQLEAHALELTKVLSPSVEGVV